MLISNDFIRMEIDSSSTDTQNAKLKISINKNTPFYHNLNGIIIEVKRHARINSDFINIWYPLFQIKEDESNMKDTIDYLRASTSGLTVTEHKIVSESFSEEYEMLSLPSYFNGKQLNQGREFVTVYLRENNTEGDIIFKETILVTTLPIPRPIIKSFKQSVVVIDHNYKLKTKVIHTNPENFYNLKLVNELGTKTLTTEIFNECIQDITTQFLNKTITSELILENDQTIYAKQKNKIKIPNQFYVWIKYNGAYRQTPWVYIKLTNEYVPVIKIYCKENEEYI